MPIVSMFDRTAPGGIDCSLSVTACSLICSRSIKLTCRLPGCPVRWLIAANLRGLPRIPLCATTSICSTARKGSPAFSGCKCNEATRPDDRAMLKALSKSDKELCSVPRFYFFGGGFVLSTWLVCCDSIFFFRSLALPLTCSACAKTNVAGGTLLTVWMRRVVDLHPGFESSTEKTNASNMTAVVKRTRFMFVISHLYANIVEPRATSQFLLSMKTFSAENSGMTKLHAWLAAGFAAIILSASAAEPAAPDYEQPKLLMGTVYEMSSGTNKVLFTSKRTAVRSNATVHVLCDYFYPNGSVAAREVAVFERGQLTFFQLDERQTAARGAAKVAADAKNPAKQKLEFDWVTSDGKKKTDSEALQRETLIGDRSEER